MPYMNRPRTSSARIAARIARKVGENRVTRPPVIWASKALSWFSLVWMTGEGVLGLIAGATAGSIALIGWALGSAIEGLAAIIVI